MANDTSFYNAQRDRLTERLSNAPLFDRPRFGYLEDAFETMMERHSDGLAPTDLHLAVSHGSSQRRTPRVSGGRLTLYLIGRLVMGDYTSALGDCWYTSSLLSLLEQS